jgi:hypothetical protein
MTDALYEEKIWTQTEGTPGKDSQGERPQKKINPASTQLDLGLAFSTVRK